jgi:predicted GTPase
MAPNRVLILGAAGRDFHTFNVFFRDHAAYKDLRAMDYAASLAKTIPEDRAAPRIKSGRPPSVPLY